MRVSTVDQKKIYADRSKYNTHTSVVYADTANQ